MKKNSKHIYPNKNKQHNGISGGTNVIMHYQYDGGQIICYSLHPRIIYSDKHGRVIGKN